MAVELLFETRVGLSLSTDEDLRNEDDCVNQTHRLHAFRVTPSPSRRRPSHGQSR